MLLLDPEAPSSALLTLAKGLAQPTRAALTLVSVVEPMPPYIKETLNLSANIDQKTHAAVTRRLERLCHAHRFTGRLWVETGTPIRVARKLAQRLKGDLIIVGHRGKKFFSRLALGSVSESVVRTIRRPVLVVKKHPRRFRRIMVPIDGSRLSLTALHVATQWAALMQADIVPVSIVEPFHVPYPVDDAPSFHATLMEAHTKAMRQWLAPFDRKRLRPSRVELGYPKRDLVRIAKEMKADLIIIGSHGRAGLASTIIGSVARALLHHAPCSILVIPPRTLS